jgi:methionyl-tRNA formyltransferase
MKSISETVVFFGSGPVAAESLTLLAQNFDIEAVITKPQPPHHKEPFPVLKLAENLGLKIILTSNKADLTRVFEDNKLKSRLGIVIDYGIIIPENVINNFPLGILNSHFSLLPKWRGADPISFAIANGDKQTGVSLMLIVEALDEGPILAKGAIDISDKTNSTSLTKELIELSDSLLTNIIPKYIESSIVAVPQEDKGVTYSHKLSKTDSRLDFKKSATLLEQEIRAYNEWPRSRTTISGVDIIITKAHTSSKNGKPGEVWQDNQELGIYTTKGSLIIDFLIPAGKKEMGSKSFLAGYTI